MEVFIDKYIEGSKMVRFYLTLMLCFIIIATSAGASTYVADPMSIGMGARALGMGRAYVGVADDADALFVNPAGIARAMNPKLTSMYSSLLNDTSYMIVGGVYPYGQKSAIGAGIISSTTGDIPLNNINGTSAGVGSWNSSVMFLSAGTYLNNLPAFSNLDRDVLIGGSFKYYSMGGMGANDVADAANSTGTAYSADLGIIYPVTDYFTLGANYQNILASKITRSSGINEDLPSTLKVGAKINLIGREGQAYSVHSTRRLFLNADYDVSGQGNVAHYGIEFWPASNLALRAGVDGQDLTAGIGVRLSGIEFNYAYHPYTSIGENATSYFSISYLGEAQKRQLRVHIDSPADKSVIYDDHVKVSGRVEVIPGDETEAPAGNLTVRVNGVNVPVEKDLTFSADVPVDTIGKKLVRVEVSDDAGDYIAQDVRLVRLTSFADVPDGYWAKVPIENTGTVGLVEGYPDGSFRPDHPLTRAELATLLVRAKGIKVPEGRATKIFKDVRPDFWAAKYIEIAWREGLIKGYPDKSFRPNNRISKAEGIVVLARFNNLKTVAEVYERPYWDVPATHWAAKYIQAAKEAGMLKYVQLNSLYPKANLARSEAVEMLSKTSLAAGKIKDLYTWEKGFRPEYTPELRPLIRGSNEQYMFVSKVKVGEGYVVMNY